MSQSVVQTSVTAREGHARDDRRGQAADSIPPSQANSLLHHDGAIFPPVTAATAVAYLPSTFPLTASLLIAAQFGLSGDPAADACWLKRMKSNETTPVLQV